MLVMVVSSWVVWVLLRRHLADVIPSQPGHALVDENAYTVNLCYCLDAVGGVNLVVAFHVGPLWVCAADRE